MKINSLITELLPCVRQFCDQNKVFLHEMQIKAIVCLENIFLCMEVTVYNARYIKRLIRRFRGRVDKVAATQNKTRFSIRRFEHLLKVHPS